MGICVEDYRQEGGRWFCTVESADMLLINWAKAKACHQMFCCSGLTRLRFPYSLIDCSSSYRGFGRMQR